MTFEATSTSQTTPPSDKPRIGIERYMEVRTAYSPTYSHDDETLYVLSTLSGLPQVWALDGKSPWPRQHSFFADRVQGVYPSPKRDLLVINVDQKGNENTQLFLTDKSGVQVEDLSQDPAHIYQFGGWSPDGAKFNYYTNRRDGKHFDVYLYDCETCEHRLVHASDYTNWVGAFSPDGRSLLIYRTYGNLDNDLYLLDLESGETKLLTPHEGNALHRSAQFSADGQQLYMLVHNDEFVRVASLHLASGTWQWLSDNRWDAETLALSHDNRYVAFSKNEDGTSRLHLLDLQQGEQPVEVAGLPELPAGVIGSIAWKHHRHTLALTLNSPLYGMEVWELDLETQQLQRVTYAGISGVPQEAFVEPELVHYASFDGMSIPAFYYRKADKKGPYPVVVYVHGGPESQSRNNFNPVVQYFVQQGFAVFVPNVRGSSGYGKTYIHLDDVRKRMDSVADLACCVEWLVQEGNAKREAIAVMGGSYGGFMTLAAVTHHPELWAAGVDIVGIANLRTFIENTSPYRRHLREPEYGTIEADGEFFDEISPIHHVDKIKAPMIVIHGANDPRVPVGEAEQIVAALQQRNHPVEYLRFEDEGHGVVKLQNRIVAYRKIAEFLQAHLV